MKAAGLLASIGITVFLYLLVYAGAISLSNRQTETIELSDTLSLYMNETGCFDAELPGLCVDQRVQVYFSVTSGEAELRLVSSNNESCEVFSENGALKTFIVDCEDDYRLLINARDADFMISVYVLDKSDQDGA